MMLKCVPILIVLLSSVVLDSCQKHTVAQQPNVVVIVVDDLGYTDIGAFGSEIRTPNLDKLAKTSLTLTNFHANVTCTVSRAMLLTGRDNHVIGFGANPGLVKRIPDLKGNPGYLGEFTPQTQTLAQRLKDNGYTTMMVGKWHLGKQETSHPPSQGFEKSFYLEAGGASHFPTMRGNLSAEDPAAFYENGNRVDQLSPSFFSTTSFTDTSIDWIDQRPETKPFFLYLAYTAPHWPLQAPDDWINRYTGTYQEGWYATRQGRINKLKNKGMLDSSFKPAENDESLYGWEELDVETKAIEERKMEIYAAMISHLDSQIGRLLDHLKKTDQFENTIIVFLSDNGPEGNDVIKVRDNETWVPDNFNLSYKNMGRENSYVWLGRNWAHVSAGPYRLYKSYLAEGGVRVPAIISYPQTLKSGKESDQLVSIMDILPTVFDLTGEPLKDDDISGQSFAHLLTSNTEFKRAPLIMEAYGNRSVQEGDWKLLWLWTPEGQGEWKLYNLAVDPGETKNLTENHPERVTAMTALWEDYVARNNIFQFSRDVGYGRYTQNSE